MKYPFTWYFVAKSLVCGVAALFASSSAAMGQLLLVAVLSSLAATLFAWVESSVDTW